MRYDGEAYPVTREAHLTSQDSHCRQAAPYYREAYLVKRISFRKSNASRFTLHERRDRSQAGC
jgi:hypothetical protein